MVKRRKKNVETGAGNLMSAALDGISAIYSAAKNTALSFTGEKVPEGKYEMRLSSIKLKEKEKEGVPVLSLLRIFTILSGENEGMSAIDSMQLSNPTGLSYALQFIVTMGYEMPELDDLPEVIELLQKEAPTCIGEVIHPAKFDGINVRIVERLEYESEMDEDEMRDDLDDLSRKELKVIIKDEDIDFKVYKSTSEANIIDAIIDDRFEEGEPDEPEKDEGDTEEYMRKELKTLTRKKLKTILKEDDIDFKVYKSTSEANIIDAIIDDRFES